MDPTPETPSSHPSEEPLTPVLATTSVVFHVRGAPNADDEREMLTLQAVADKLRKAVRQAFEGEHGVEAIGVVSLRYPHEEDSNVYRCDECGMWLTNPDEPDPCESLSNGYFVGGARKCDQHYEMAVRSGRFPRPAGWIEGATGDPATTEDVPMAEPREDS